MTAKKRGLAVMTPEQRRAIALKGVQARREKGIQGHRYTPDEARIAGVKGGRLKPTAAQKERMSQAQKLAWARRKEEEHANR